jgi:CheY-like chemotaxis protein
MGRQLRILIADDDDIMLIGVAELLRRRGARVETTDRLVFSDAPASYDLVILDPHIGQGGLRSARQFVADAIGSRPAPSLIVVSEYLDEVETLGVSPSRFVEFHAKPVRVAKLAESVEAMLQGSAAGEDAR